MKILIVTTPIRQAPTEFPPFGSLAVLSALQRSGRHSAEFYDIDGLRPSHDEVLKTIALKRPRILGISAVVSTGYAYAKRLSRDVKRILPGTTIVLGGNLAASAEVLLNRAGVDFCVIGEGERVMVNLADVLDTDRPRTAVHAVRGLVYLDGNRLVNTGYEDPLSSEELYDIDWTVLERSSRIENFIMPATRDVLLRTGFWRDARTHESRRRGKTLATLVGSKGCVSRCTFCHRWNKGIRYIPVPVLMRRVSDVIERYNVGFLTWGDENFGTDRRWLKLFCDSIRKYDLIWQVSGMRVNCVSREQLMMMKEAGCCAVHFGMESGSARMLEVMEKKTRVEDNYAALRWTADVGLGTAVQLVVGMPGETTETVAETVRFVEYASKLDEARNPVEINVNFPLALPGTPLYEYARARGFIGRALEDEEQYLVAVSDSDASNEANLINFTSVPKLTLESWRPRIVVSAAAAYIAKFGRKQYLRQLAGSGYLLRVREAELAQKAIGRDGFQLSGIVRLILAGQWRAVLVLYPTICAKLRALLPVMVLLYDTRRNGSRYASGLALEWIGCRLRGLYQRRRVGRASDYTSLRKILEAEVGVWAADRDAMIPLRRGR